MPQLFYRSVTCRKKKRESCETTDAPRATKQAGMAVCAAWCVSHDAERCCGPSGPALGSVCVVSLGAKCGGMQSVDRICSL